MSYCEFLFEDAGKLSTFGVGGLCLFAETLEILLLGCARGGNASLYPTKWQEQQVGTLKIST